MSDNNTPWYARWFGKTYLELYPHRDDNEARMQIEFVTSQAAKHSTQPIIDVLDIGCGAGRHLLQLAAKSFAATGIDLSTELLKVAASRIVKENLSAKVVQGDMRELPFADGSFDLLLSMFTSFGYFPEDADNEAALREWYRTLDPEGVLFIDFLNREVVINNLVPHSTKQLGDKTIVEHRSISSDGRRVEKTIEITENEVTETFFESVRMFSREELEAMLVRNGFSPVSCFGDFNGSPFTNDAERLLIFATSS